MTTQTTIAPARAKGVPDLRDLDLDTLLELYPSNSEPMPDLFFQLPHFVALIEMLNRWFEDAKIDALAAGDNFIYYLDELGKTVAIAPDIIVMFDIDVDKLYERGSYFVDIMGKPPGFVMEIGSKSTAQVDLEEKPRKYAWIGVLESWLFDPTGGDHYGFALRGWRLVDGEYQPIEMDERSDGSSRGYSAVLGLELHWDGSDLHLIDPVSGQRLRRPSEIAADERAALSRAEAERQARQTAEARAETERRAREAAEAELARLRRLLDSPDA